MIPAGAVRQRAAEKGPQWAGGFACRLAPLESFSVTCQAAI